MDDLSPEEDQIIDNTQVRGGFLLMEFALLWSEIFSTINFRLGSGLVLESAKVDRPTMLLLVELIFQQLAAQKLVHGWQSLPLAKEQWKVEARQLFETSPARIQIQARNVAFGAGARYPGLLKLPSTEPELCHGTFMFESQRWQNINVTGSVWVLVCSLIFLLLAVPIPEERLAVQWLWNFLIIKLPHFFKHTVRGFFVESLTRMFNNMAGAIRDHAWQAFDAVRRLFGVPSMLGVVILWKRVHVSKEASRTDRSVFIRQ